jgi:hypothetical protein
MTLMDYNVQNVSSDLFRPPQQKRWGDPFFVIQNADSKTGREAHLSRFSVYLEVLVSRVSFIC